MSAGFAKPRCPARVFGDGAGNVIAETGPEGLSLTIAHGATPIRVKLDCGEALRLAALILGAAGVAAVDGELTPGVDMGLAGAPGAAAGLAAALAGGFDAAGEPAA